MLSCTHLYYFFLVSIHYDTEIVESQSDPEAVDDCNEG